jgi:hypothetical protein
MRLGKRMKQALRFARALSGWHTYANDVKQSIMRLEKLGLVEVNQFNQFRITEKGFYLFKDKKGYY